MRFIKSVIIFMLPLMAFSQEEASFYVEFQDQSIYEVLIEIEYTYDVRFSYKDKDLEGQRFSLTRTEATLSEVLGAISSSTGLIFNVIDSRYIIVLKGENTELSLQQLNDIVIYGYLAKGISKAKDASFTIVPNELEILPGLTEPDILESLQQLPSVISPNETASGLVVRGGVADQNRLIWDGINMYHKGHLFGMISPFNPYAADKVTFINKGTHPRFGDRVSSVIDITSTDEVTNKFKGSAGFNAINADAYLEIPIIEDKLSIQGSFRRSYTELYQSYTFDQLADKVFQSTKIEEQENADNDFSFLDFNVKLNYKPSDKDNIHLSVIHADNNLDYRTRDITTDENFNDIMTIRNTGYSAKWNRIWNDRLTQTTSAFFSDYKFNYNFIINEDGTQVYDFDKRNIIFDSGVSSELNFAVNENNDLTFGYQYGLKDVNYAFISTDELSFILDSDQTVVETHSAYTNYILRKPNRYTINVGLRGSYYAQLDAIRIEPRALVYVPVFKGFKIQASGEIKNQIISEIDETVLSDLTLENRLWRLSNGTEFPIINSNQWSLGFVYSRNGWRLDVDHYYKNIKNVTALSLGFLNPENSSFTIGKQRIVGVDVLLEKDIKRFKAWLSYSFNKMDNKYEGLNGNQYFTSSTNVRHVFNSSVTYKYKKLQMALGWRWQSGKPFTESMNTDNGVVFQGINTGRLPVYHRLDFSSTYDFDLSKDKDLKARIGLSIRNIYNRNNQLSREYFGNNSLDDPIRTIDKFSLGFTPNLLFRVFW
ncbi:FecR domain-containing protein [Winogradskyella sp. 3972H.M.0a.05]|uniref:FecR domain-containing protein n=1 Tax=Winogradskyella sp. 3972H.M.0a.05 TaxID=2950277 RepID=UPI00339A7D6E